MTHISADKLYSSITIYVFRILNNITRPECYILLITEELESYIKNRYPSFKYIIFKYSHNNVNNCPYIFKHIKQFYNYRKVVNNSGCDVVFIASDMYLYTCVPVKPSKIVVIHDLKAIKEKGDTALKRIKIYLFHKYYYYFMKSAQKIIAISNFTKQDILMHYNIKKEKIAVIYNSIELSCDSIMLTPMKGINKYILYVNTLLPYKNIITLVKAFINLKNEIDEDLVIVGKKTDYWNRIILPLIEKNNITNRVILLENISNSELKYLYIHASLFVSTSLREGFGYTPIEAAICECPVICTRCEALSDTTQNMLYYYSHPTDDKELSARIIEILNKEREIESLKKISEEFSKLYSPKRQVDELEHLFNL